MPDIRYIPLGVGDAFSAKHYSCCLLVETEGSRLLLDCPHPIRKMLREGSEKALGETLDLDAIDGVVLSHLHADHCSGLDSLAAFYRHVLGRKLKLIAHPDVVAPLWDERLRAGMRQEIEVEYDGDGFRSEPKVSKTHTLDFEDYFELVPLGRRHIDFGPWRIGCHFNVHHVPTTAIAVVSEPRSLAYSADTAYSYDLLEWMWSCDEMIHEVGYGSHTPHERLMQVPRELRARMKLIHYPDQYAPEDAAAELLEEGKLYQVEPNMSARWY